MTHKPASLFHTSYLIGYSRKILKTSTHRSSHPEIFCKKGVLKNFAKFTGKHLCQCLVFNTVAGLRPATSLKKRLWHTYFPVNFAKFLRTPFLILSTSGGCFYTQQMALESTETIFSEVYLPYFTGNNNNFCM